jgi:ribosomal protein S18 acetylase RimI-like enzyme
MFIRQLTDSDPIPYDLLLLADPEREIIDSYIHDSWAFAAYQEGQLVGCYVLANLTADSAEIKNIVVSEQYQNQGIGKSLLAHAIQTAKSHQKKQLVIATADSSTIQLQLYQKIGFQILEVQKDYFPKHYKNPIFENEIQCVDRIVLGMGV